MNKKTSGIIVTVIVALLCACLPLCAGVFGLADMALQLDMIGADTNMYVGIGGICAGLLGVIVAVVVGILMLRKKPEETLPTDEPLPPAY
jgi:membrane associated rhomboid family serine protease